MTPPPKPKKPLIIIEHSEKFKSKPEQIQSSQEGVHTVIENISYNIAKRAAGRLKEKEK